MATPPIYIAGVHRSGTSMVTRLLHLCGVALGPTQDLELTHSSDSPEGYWENVLFRDLNIRLIEVMDNLWGSAASAPAGWPRQAAFDPFRDEAARLAAQFANVGCWGWKDPRNCVTLEFWLDHFADMKIVLCVRNPLEVAASLVMRGTFTYEQALQTWSDDMRQFLRDAPPNRLVVTHYESWFYDPNAELMRLVEALELPASEKQISAGIVTIRSDLYRNPRPTALLNSEAVSRSLREQYSALTRMAGPVYQRLSYDMAYQRRILERCLTVLQNETPAPYWKSHAFQTQLEAETMAPLTAEQACQALAEQLQVERLARESLAEQIEQMRRTRGWRALTIWWRLKQRVLPFRRQQ